MFRKKLVIVPLVCISILLVFRLLTACATSKFTSDTIEKASALSQDDSSIEESSGIQDTSTNQMESENLAKNYKDFEKHVEPFSYSIGRKSWNNAEEIEPDALAEYYIYLGSTDEVTFSSTYPKDKEFNNPLIPADVLEKGVQKHFDVSAEHIRKSQYYDPENNAYWTGGIGTTVDIYVVDTEQKGDLETIDFEARIESSDYKASWDGTIVVQLTEDNNYKFISYERNNFKEQYP